LLAFSILKFSKNIKRDLQHRRHHKNTGCSNISKTCSSKHLSRRM